MLLAWRWPLTALSCTWLFVSAAERLLREPIAVRIEGGVGGVQLEKVEQPIEVRTASPLNVDGTVRVSNREAIPVLASDIVVRRPISVRAADSIPVEASRPIPVAAAETISVSASRPIPVSAPHPIAVSTGGPVSANVVVEEVKSSIEVRADHPLPVDGSLSIQRIEDPIRVNARGRFFPFRIP